MSKCVDLIKKHEGLRLFPYMCSVGKLTIGYGRNIEDTGISKEEAETLLKSDVDACVLALCDKTDYYLHLNEARQAVIVNMVFNLGWSRFNQFKNMIKAIRGGDYSLASIEMLDSKWSRQVGGRAKELAAIMKSGKY